MKKVSILFIIVAMVGSSCKKDWLTSLQTNPNAPVVASGTPPLVLPGTLTSLVGIINGPFANGGYQSQGAWMGYWNYSGGYSFNQTVQEYVMTNGQPQVWDQYYGVLANLNFITNYAQSNPDYYAYGAVANVLESICYKNLVDAYEDVPYSQALQGVKNFFPTYDKGSDIYDSLTLKLDAAITALQSTPSATAIAIASDDILFGGDLTQWAKFANTLKLRLLVNESNVASKNGPGGLIASEIANTASVGYLTTDALVNPGYSAAQQGPMYGFFGISPSGSLNGDYNYIRAGATALNFYISTNDPRFAYFYSSKGQDPTNTNIAKYGDYYAAAKGVVTSSAGYAADVLGIQVTQPTKGSGIGPGLIQSPTQGAPLMTAAESYFVQAEAVVRGYLAIGNAQTLYDDGIKASFEYLGVGGSTGDPDALATAYYSQTGVTNVSWPASQSDQEQAIITQKWAALNGIANAESWNDWRRTGFPVVPLSASPTLASGSHIPYRYYYPNEEPTENPTAWTAAGGAQIDPYTSKIFWMP